MSAFALHSQLAADTHAVADLPLSRLLLMDDAQYPWCILVPRREGVREIYELPDADQTALLRESVQLGRALMQQFRGHKLNVAALGNQVPQLHLHHVVRFEGDAAWPKPVWGLRATVRYTAAERNARLQAIRAALGLV